MAQSFVIGQPLICIFIELCILNEARVELHSNNFKEIVGKKLRKENIEICHFGDQRGV